MLIELLIAMTFIVVAVGALMASYAASMVSLHRSGTEGTALTLADRQIEAYKSLPYDSIQLASSTIPGGSDPYVTANSSDATIPSSTGQITGGTRRRPAPRRPRLSPGAPRRPGPGPTISRTGWTPTSSRTRRPEDEPSSRSRSPYARW